MQPLKRYDHQKTPNDSPWTLSQRIKMVFWDYVWLIFCLWTPKPANFWRLIVLKAFGCKIEGKPFVHQRARIQIPWNLTLRDRACLGDRSNLYALGKIEIGRAATIAQEAYLCTGTHDFSSPSVNLMTAPIFVGANAFIGARAFVMPGISIGENAVVGACTLVTQDVPDGMVVVGNPGRLLRKRHISEGQIDAT